MDAFQIILLIAGLILTFTATSVARWYRLRQTSPQPTLASPARPDSAPALPLAPPAVNITALDLIYGAAMLLGIVAKELWDTLNESGRLGLQPTRLLAALIVSPIIYAAVYSRFIQGELTLLGLAVAFQNGFFWQAVFRTAQGGV